MRVILMLIKKEFLQVFRNPLLMSILIVAPLVQFLLFPFTADYEIKHINIAFIDHDRSSTSQDIIKKFLGSPYFITHGILPSNDHAQALMLRDEIDFTLEFPVDFEKDLVNQQKTEIAITANAINSVKAGIGTAYVQNVIAEYMNELMAVSKPDQGSQAQILATNVYWFNEQMNYKNLIVPGILVILVTLIGAYVTALNIVREKELGTIEQINVTPIKRWQFIVGKMIPFWILGMAEFIIGLILMKLVFGITVQGSIVLLLGITAIYLLAMLGLGFFISSVSENQLQAMFIVFFLFIVFVLLSGLFTPTEGMPDWAIKLNYLNPLSFYMDVIKIIVLKGGVLQDVKIQIIALSCMAVIIDTAAILSYQENSK
ncbi:ABC transporter permease [Bacteroidales bacterium OttesenSCG-928-B11]|nr:ABC transporter permease [Bacteroidales bacterium OttesenSCG-928-C03]MDL2311586.1 ABC transporter permease [Bacteroidales bacterium OttesenSCG-928-B11]